MGKRLLWRAFVAGQALGVDVLPRHFYSSIPDVRGLRADRSWQHPNALTGVAGTDLDRQEATLASYLPYEVQRSLARRDVYAEACATNGAVGFGPIEAQVLYGYVSATRPRRVLQIGAGVSTAVILAAAADTGIGVDVVCVDPYPTEFLLAAAADGRIRLVRQPAQEMDLALIDDLGAGDLLFVDSTHTVRPGSEVNRIVLEMLPRVSADVGIHFHDITFPYDYPGDLLTGTLFFWSETSLLQAFLTNNSSCRLAVSLAMLHHQRPAALAALLPSYRPAAMTGGLFDEGHLVGHYPTSAYLRTGPFTARGANPTPRRY